MAPSKRSRSSSPASSLDEGEEYRDKKIKADDHAAGPRRDREQGARHVPSPPPPLPEVEQDFVMAQATRAVAVTPATVARAPPPETNEPSTSIAGSGARRALAFASTPAAARDSATIITPPKDPPPTKRRLAFGRSIVDLDVPENVRQVYGIIKKLTGSIGGNGAFGPIYGELTMGSMQKMINLMKQHTEFSASSRFIDVGSGIGKPNLHVTQDPGVEFSFGIEIEESRFVLGLNCLKGVLDAASQQAAGQLQPSDNERIRYHCIFAHGSICDARSFDPFTHVYMFSIGFPPRLWEVLAEMWNRSASAYLICYHGPKDIIHSYEFQVELVTQMPTSMHGSSEGHMGYIYRRTTLAPVESNGATPRPFDPFYASAFRSVTGGLGSLKEEVDGKLQQYMQTGATTRARRRGR